MASSGGPSYIPMAELQGDAASHTEIPMPAQETTVPPTFLERLQFYLFGPEDNMDLIEAAREGKREDCDRILQRGISNVNTQDKETKQTALHVAARHGNDELLDLLLSHKAKVNIQDSDGNTPLHLALNNGHCSSSKKILASVSKKIDSANNDHKTPLHLAVETGHLEIADDLLKKSAANINASDNKQNTALHIAALQGKEGFIDVLKKYNAECNVQDSDGNTPLHLAIKYDHCSCSKKILEWDNINTNLVNKKMETSLHVAVSRDYKAIVEKRLEKIMTGSSVSQDKKRIKDALHDEVTKDYKDIVEKILKTSKVTIDTQNMKNKETALHIATRMKKDDIVDLLLTHNANCNAQNKKERTALHLALIHNPECAKKILQRDNLQIDLVSEDHKTPLYLAVEKNNIDIVQKLLEKDKANIDAQHKETKQTVLHVAANSGKEKLVEILLNKKANCNIQDSQGDTPLHMAIKTWPIEKGLNTIAVKLLDMELDHSAMDSSGNTALHLLIEYGYSDCCKKLLQKDTVNLNAKTKTGDTPLHLAAREGKHDFVALLRSYAGDCQADCNSRNNSQDTPLHLAVDEGHLNCVTELLKFKNMAIDSTNKDDFTALHCAVKKGNSNLVSELLLCGADCNAKDRLGNTPLHCAVTKGDVACCEKLLDRRDLKINEQNTSQEAALHVAARLGHHSVCDLILKQPDTIIHTRNKRQCTPLHLAAKESHHEVTLLLLNKGASWRVKDKNGKMPLHYAAENGCVKSCEYLVNAFKKIGKPYDFKLKNGRTPLMLAAMGGHHHCCQILPLDGIDLQDDGEKNALMYAVEKDFKKTASFLLRNNAKTDLKVLSKENRGNQTKENHKGKEGQQTKKVHGTVLHLAAAKKASKCLKCLLEYPKTRELLFETDKDGLTPLHVAINSEALECAKILLSQGASPTAITNTGMTPLHLAAKRNDQGLCSLLLSWLFLDVDMNAENKNRETPLHVAAKHGRLGACRVLMKKGIKKIAKDISGRTPLHLAAENGHAHVVQFLLKKGAREKDDEDSSALHLAAAKGHLQVCQILVSECPGLVKKVNKEGKLSVDVAFENQKDEVFAFLIGKLDLEEKNEENLKKKKRFHNYMHQALESQGQNTSREDAAEGILASEWWRAAFFVEQEKGHNTGTKDQNEYSHTQERSSYCTNFHEMINNHPKLALKTLDLCHESLSPMSDQTLDFRLFDCNLCSESGMKHPGRPHAPIGKRLLQDHPVSLMMKKDECPGLLLHPYTDSWLMHKWRTSVSYMFMFLFCVEVLYLASLHLLMDNMDNWEQIQQKCNTTQEQFCRLSSSPGRAEVALPHTDTTQDGLLLEMVKAEVDGTFRCSQRTLLWQWIFVVVMTVIIAFLECIHVYTVQKAYMKGERLLRIIQTILTILSWVPMGACGFQHNVSYTWQWHCGIISLLLQWILVIQRLNQLPVIFVFMPITRQFLWGYTKALLYIGSLLFVFSYIFHLLLHDQDAFESRLNAFVMMIVWLHGDLNYDSTFIERTPLHPHMTTFMFVFFFIIMGGFIANLAVTLPSERLEDFRRNATFNQKLAQSTFLLETQAYISWFNWPTSKSKSDKRESEFLVNKIMDKLFTGDIMQNNPLKDLEQQVASLVNLCREQGREMKDIATNVSMCQEQGKEVKDMFQEQDREMKDMCQEQGREMKDMWQEQGREMKDIATHVSMCQEQVSKVKDMCQEQGKEIKEIKQQLNDILFKHIAEKD